MTKKELIANITDHVDLTQAQVAAVLDAEAAVIITALAAGNGAEVKAEPLGRFHTKTRAARSGTNPATGEQAHYPAKNVVQFKPAKALRDAVEAGY